MKYHSSHKRRLERVLRWYAQERFGLFYHFGLFTGGGNACDDARWAKPLHDPTSEAFEKEAVNPRVIARNLAKTEKAAGAKVFKLTF